MATNKHIAPETPAKSRPRPLWRNRDYFLLWSGQAVSSVGGEVTQLGLPLLILSLTHSPEQVGIAAALRSLAYLVLGLPAGALVDRWNRKRTMIACDTGRALLLGSIPLALALGHLTMAQIYLVTLVEGTLFVFFGLAESAALPHVVETAQLPEATAQSEVTAGVVTLIGPALGGALFGLGRMLPFIVDTVSYAASVISLSQIRTPFQGERRSKMHRLWMEVREGLTWLWREPVVRSLALLHSGLILCVSGMTLLLLIIAEKQHAAPFAIGLMFGIGGLGSMLGAMLGSQAHKHLRLGQILVGAFWLFAALWPLYGIAPSPLALGAILGAFWVVDEIYDVSQISYRLAQIPDALRGRVNGAFRLLAFGCDALGVLIMGLLLQKAGVGATVFCFEVGLVVLALTATLNHPLQAARPLVEL